MTDLDYFFVEISGFKIAKDGGHYPMLRMSKRLGEINGMTLIKFVNELSSIGEGKKRKVKS